MLLSFLLSIVIYTPTRGQDKQKQLLTKEQYGQWSTLLASAISADGKWASYSLKYASRLDTLVVTSTDGSRRLSYPKGSKPFFSRADWFACLIDQNVMVLVSLKFGKEKRIENVSQFEFSANGRLLVLIGKKESQLQNVRIMNLTNGEVESIGAVDYYSFNPDYSGLAYTTEKGGTSKICLVNLDNETIQKETLSLEGIAYKITWQSNGQSIAFSLGSEKEEITKEAPLKIGYYVIGKKKLYVLNPSVTQGFPKDKKIVVDYTTQLNVSDDGLRILFQVAPLTKTGSTNAGTVEIWHGADSHLYSERKSRVAFEDRTLTWVWYPDTDTLLDFMTNENSVLISGNQKSALSSDFNSCGPQFKFDSDRDYYLTDLTNGIRIPFLSCHSGNALDTYMSPLGNYVAYFKEGNWFSYDVTANLHRNLTQPAGVAFFNENDDKAGAKDVYLLAGWSSDDRYLFVYDQYDMWRISTDGSDRKRLTNGRENGISYRVARISERIQLSTFLSIERPTVLDLDRPILFEGHHYGDSKQGYMVFEKGKMRILLYVEKQLSTFLKADTKDAFVCVEETYEQAPRLVFKKNASEKLKKLYQSNPQQANYNWGYNQTITYTNKKGQHLKGILYYPASYEKGKKYPMIVQIYEQQYYLKNRYFAPSLFNSDGINITNYVIDGYFVFLPDIVYEVGSPGDSAFDCVTAAVEEVLSLHVIDATKIGLTGHSFGGYETTYIIGKSKLFATAVAGAAQTDLVSCYLTVGEAYKRSEFWRFEDYSNRMGKMLFDDLNNYIYNSPIYNATNINAPVLLWTGDKDGVVAPKQSMELYLSLRRLGKKVALLRYKDEYHSVSDASKQVDLTAKIADWFNYYLKEYPSAPWMEITTNN